MKVLKDYKKAHKKEFRVAISQYYGNFIWFDVIAFCIAYVLTLVLFFAGHGGCNMEAFMFALKYSLIPLFIILWHFCRKFTGFRICDVTVAELICDDDGVVCRVKDTDGKTFSVTRQIREKLKVGSTYMVFIKNWRLIDEFYNMPNFIAENPLGD